MLTLPLPWIGWTSRPKTFAASAVPRCLSMAANVNSDAAILSRIKVLCPCRLPRKFDSRTSQALRDELAAGHLSSARAAEARDMLGQCLLLVGAKEQPRVMMPPPGFLDVSATVSQGHMVTAAGETVALTFGLRFGAKYAYERAKFSSDDLMRRHWEMSLRTAFNDPSLQVLNLVPGSVIAMCASNIPFSLVVQCSLELAKTSDTGGLPPLEGLGLTPNVHHGSHRIEWLSPTKLKALLPLLPSTPTVQPPASTALPSPQDALPPAVPSRPITREEFAAMVSEFNDTATLDRMSRDPSYTPWIVPS